MTSPRVVGLDLSWTGAGLADNRGHAFTFGTDSKYPGGKRARLEATMQAVREFVLGDPWLPLKVERPELVVVEAPAFGAKGSAVVDLGGLWWHVTQTLWLAGVPLVPITTGTLKMYATGKGSGGKAATVAAVARREPDLEVRDDNVPDACVLRALGCALLGYPLPGWDRLPKTHTRALEVARKAAADNGVSLVTRDTCTALP